MSHRIGLIREATMTKSSKRKKQRTKKIVPRRQVLKKMALFSASSAMAGAFTIKGASAGLRSDRKSIRMAEAKEAEPGTRAADGCEPPDGEVTAKRKTAKRKTAKRKTAEREDESDAGGSEESAATMSDEVGQKTEKELALKADCENEGGKSPSTKRKVDPAKRKTAKRKRN